MKFVYPNKKYYQSYDDAFKEYQKNKVKTYSFSDIHSVDVEKKFFDYRKGVNLKPNRVPQTTFWLIDKGEFVGEISIRHKLNEALKRYGGHIGFGVKLSKWNSGYGTKMLAMALERAKKMGLEKVLITCDFDNFASAKVIENNGGKLQDIIENTIDGKKILTKRYWIAL